MNQSLADFTLKQEMGERKDLEMTESNAILPLSARDLRVRPEMKRSSRRARSSAITSTRNKQKSTKI